MIELRYIVSVGEEFEESEIAELAESMKERGLLHPIQVRPRGEMYEVVAGRKRVRAAIKLNWDMIGGEVHNLTDEEAVEVSLHENIKRKNLTWYERADLLARFHDHQQEVHGAAPEKGGRGSSGWGLRDTAEALGVGLGSLSESVNLAAAVRLDPSLRNIKDKRTATRLVRTAAQRIERELEAGAEDIFREFELDQLMLGSSVDILSHVPDNTFDACITDPPWLKFHGQKELEKDKETLSVFDALYPTLKPDAFLYIFIGFDDLPDYLRELPKMRYKVSKTPLIWHKKGSMSRMGVRPWEYGRDLELILVAVKGSPVLTTPNQLSSIMAQNIVPPRKMIHPHEKPVDLISLLLSDCTFEGNAVVDPFAGSGVVGEACKRKDRRYYLIEREKKFYDGIQRRLAEAV